MKRTILASFVAAGGMVLLTLNLLSPVPLPSGTGEETAKAPVQKETSPIEETFPVDSRQKTEEMQQSWDETHSVALLCDEEVKMIRLDDYLTGVVRSEDVV